MNGTERYVSIIHSTFSVNAESCFICHLESNATGFTHNQMAALREEFAVYQVKFLCLGTQLLFGLIPYGFPFFYHRGINIKIAFMFRLLINGKHARKD